MSMVLIVRLLNPLSISVLQVTGRWNTYAKILLLDAVSIVISAAIGAQSRDLTTLAICVGIGRCVVVPILVAAANATLGVSQRSLAVGLVQRVGIPVAGVVTFWVLWGFPGTAGISDAAAAAVILILTTVPLPWLFRADLQLLRRMLVQSRQPSTLPPENLVEQP
jgi:hypothetical protein